MHFTVKNIESEKEGESYGGGEFWGEGWADIGMSRDGASNIREKRAPAPYAS